MKKVSKRTIFSKSMSVIYGIIGRYSRIANNDYKYSKSYNFKDHIMSTLYMQFSDSNGLRDLDLKYKNHRCLGKDFKIPSYSQLSRLNSQKSFDNFRLVFLDVLELAQRELTTKEFCREFNDIKIIDSTVLTVGSGLSPKLKYEGAQSAVRISTLLSKGTQLPEKIEVVPATVGERSCIKDFIKGTDFLYLFDKGYYKYSWYDEMSDRGISFITRQQGNAITEEYKSYHTGLEDIYDYDVTMGTDYSKNKTRYKYREILYFEEGSDEEFRLVTNVFHLPPQDIISIYKVRWNIETYFKWIKQHLILKHWSGYSLNAMSIQIYSALIIYILVLLLKKRFKCTLTLFNVLRTLRAYINQSYALETILTG
jgi:hypothetical protein